MAAVREVNRIPQIQAVIKELDEYKVEVGIFAPEGSELFMIAMVNEYGCNIQVTDKMRAYLHKVGLHLKAETTEIKIPERSFIRGGYDSAAEELRRLVMGLLPRVIHLEMTPQDFYGIIGEFTVGKIHEYIQALTHPPNHPYTVEKKKSSHPLINTGRLNQSITYQVVKK